MLGMACCFVGQGDRRLGGIVNAQELEDKAFKIERILDGLAQGGFNFSDVHGFPISIFSSYM